MVKIQLIKYNKYNFLIFNYHNCNDAEIKKKFITSLSQDKFFSIELVKNTINKIRFR